jgi:drug/metabolite transporter (DMT)-like permease
MSILLTVSFTVLVFHEHFGWLEGIGLIFALLAILFMNMKKTGTNDLFSSPSKFFLLLVLACSSSIEILLFYVEKTGLVGQEQVTFTSHGFGIAAAFGWLVLAFTWFKGKIRITLKDVFAGFMLGVPNFFSIYFLLLMLNKGWNGSIMYPLVNVSVLLCSTAVAVMAFSEKLTKLNWIGILMATAAILTIAYAQNASDWKISF